MTEPLHPALRRTFEHLSDAGVRWALLRLPRSLSRVEGDVDVLVHPADEQRASSSLRRAGFLPIAGAGASRPLVTYDVPSRAWLHLDLTAQTLPGPLGGNGHLSAACLGRRRGGDPVWRLDPADEFWSLLAHVSEPGRRLRARHWAALREAAPSADASPVATELARRFPDRAGVLLDARAAVLADDPDRLQEILAVLTARNPRRRGIGRLPRTARTLSDAWRYRGMSVALLGPDGAGKSTLARCLREQAFFPTRVIYMGTGISGELSARPKPLRFLRGPLLFSLGGMATQWARYLQGLADRLRGRMVIFDRYTEEALLPAKPADPPWRRAGRAVRRRLVCPPPELAIVLDVAGAVMYSRKGEHDAAKLEAERERYRALVNALPEVIVVDAQQAPAEVCAHAMEGIWGTYRRRFAVHGTAARSGGSQG